MLTGTTSTLIFENYLYFFNHYVYLIIYTKSSNIFTYSNLNMKEHYDSNLSKTKYGFLNINVKIYYLQKTDECVRSPFTVLIKF